MNHEEEWYDRHHISKQYKNTHGTFYMLFIDNTDEVQNRDNTPYGTYSFLIDSLDWAFCDNKWVFRQFLKFYDCILDAVSYHVEEFRNVTWDEFEDAVKSKHTHLVNLEMFIYYSECDLPNGYYCFNETLMNDFHADTAEYDVINEDYRYDWFELLEIVNSGWLVESPMVRDIRKFITKFCKCYALSHALMEHWYEICDDFDLPQNEWFSHLPDYAKVSLTKEANFPMLLGDIDEAELVDNNYLFWLYVKRCLGDDEEDQDIDDGSQQLWDRR